MARIEGELKVPDALPDADARHAELQSLRDQIADLVTSMGQLESAVAGPAEGPTVADRLAALEAAVASGVAIPSGGASVGAPGEEQPSADHGASEAPGQAALADQPDEAVVSDEAVESEESEHAVPDEPVAPSAGEPTPKAPETKVVSPTAPRPISGQEVARGWSG